jgi:hypothetical protein
MEIDHKNPRAAVWTSRRVTRGASKIRVLVVDVCKGIGDISARPVADSARQQANDGIVRLTSSSICGTDLHMNP